MKVRMLAKPKKQQAGRNKSWIMANYFTTFRKNHLMWIDKNNFLTIGSDQETDFMGNRNAWWSFKSENETFCYIFFCALTHILPSLLSIVDYSPEQPNRFLMSQQYLLVWEFRKYRYIKVLASRTFAEVMISPKNLKSVAWNIKASYRRLKS